MAEINSPTRILSAATTTGAGSSNNMRAVFQTFTFVKSIAGVFTALSVTYEGSLDGTTWFTLGTDATTTAGATHVVDKPCIYTRANVTAFTDGTSVTVDMVPN